MPVILESDEARQVWLRADGNNPSIHVLRLLRPYEGKHIVYDKVSTMVNSIKNVHSLKTFFLHPCV
jgi:putative SOS response-associated peptidase YedK